MKINWPGFWKNRYETEHEEHGRSKSRVKQLESDYSSWEDSVNEKIKDIDWLKDQVEVCEGKVFDHIENAKKSEACISELTTQLGKLKALKIPQSVRPKVKEVARKNGHIYYIFDDLTNLPYIRAQQIGHLLNLMNCGIDPDYMAGYLKSANTVFWEDKDPEKLYNLLEGLRERFGLGFNTEMLYQIAANMILRDDEPHEDVPEMMFKEKIKDWKESGDGIFFLTIAYGMLMKQSVKSGESTPDGLQKKLKKLIKQEESIIARTKTT